MSSTLVCACLEMPESAGFQGHQEAGMALKACPFCSSGHQHIYEVDAGIWAVYCSHCKAVGPQTSSRHAAIARWASRRS
jgi:hypothetical protein